MFQRYFLAPLAALLVLAAAPRLAHAQTGGVGIGTTAPDASAALDIVNSSKGLLLPRVAAASAIARPAPGLLVYQTGAPAGFYYNAGTAAAPSWQQMGTTTNGDNLGSHTATRKLDLAAFPLVGNGGSTGLTISSGGNVGIGTGTPATTLDVRTANNTAAITVGQTDNTAGALYLGNSAHGLKRNYSSGNDVGLYTTAGNVYLSTAGGSTDQLMLRSDGLLRVGNAGAPGALEVLSGSSTTTSTTSLDQQFTGASKSGNGTGFWQTFEANQTGTLTRIEVQMVSPGTYNGGGFPAQFDVYQGSVSGPNVSSQSIEVGLNYGFQSITLATPVPVVQGQTYAFRVYLPQYAYNGGFGFISTPARAPGQGWYGYSASPRPGGPYPVGTSSLGLEIDTGFKTYVTNYTTTADRSLTVQNSGRVGINTADPVHPLTVQADGSGAALGFASAGTDKYNWSLTNGGLNLSESNVAGGRLFVQDGGNVGIGTTSPIARLHVSGSA